MRGLRQCIRNLIFVVLGKANQMIITVTMNPAIDRTISIPALVRGGLNRISHIEQDAGGKGINVSKTIRALGGSSIAVGFIAGNAGEMIERTLKHSGIETDFIRISGETRTNTKVAEPDGTVTELNEPGPEITRQDLALLIRKLESYAGPDTLFVLAGSTPSGAPPTIYQTITEKMHALGASVLPDCDGALFAHTLKARPDIIKPNRFELETYFSAESGSTAESLFSAVTNPYSSGRNSDVRNADIKNTDIKNIDMRLLEMGRCLLHQGIRYAAISLGQDGALFLGPDECYRSTALSVDVRSTVGAGDAMVSALALGWERKLPFRDCAALAMAASAGAVTTPGTKPPSQAIVNELLGQVQLEFFK